MARSKFRINENDVMDELETKETPQVIERDFPKVAEDSTANNIVFKEDIPVKEETSEQTEQGNESKKKNKRENKTVLEGNDNERPANEVKIKLNISMKKRETKSHKTVILIRPSTKEKADLLLNKFYGGMAFNELVNQLLEGWVEDVSKQLNN